MEHCNTRSTFVPLYKIMLFFFAFVMFIVGGVKTAWANSFSDYVNVSVILPNSKIENCNEGGYFQLSNDGNTWSNEITD